MMSVILDREFCWVMLICDVLFGLRLTSGCGSMIVNFAVFLCFSVENILNVLLMLMCIVCV